MALPEQGSDTVNKANGQDDGANGQRFRWASMKARSASFAGIPALLLFGCSGGDAENGANIPNAECKGLAEQTMVWIEGGTFVMGEAPRYPEEGPPQTVEIEGFYISATEVTNTQFAEFVKATGYQTLAERPPAPIPDAPPEMLQPGSAVFRVPSKDNPAWWAWVVGANWQEPSGPGSSIKDRPNDPVIHVTYHDARAYAEWAGLALPTEAQWEFAARAGEKALREPVDASGVPVANFYQGVFPARDTAADGFTSRAPVGCFKANSFGLYDMIGNVWEWTSDESRAGHPANLIKGGSYLCASNYCARYRPAARQFQERNLGTDHIGFRVVDNSRPAPR